jgi:hypothetical protein
MEYRIEMFGAEPDPSKLYCLLDGEDAAAIADFDGMRRIWRINTSLLSRELIELFARAGCRLAPGQLRVVPSVCCGGCSG